MREGSVRERRERLERIVAMIRVWVNSETSGTTMANRNVASFEVQE